MYQKIFGWLITIITLTDALMMGDEPHLTSASSFSNAVQCNGSISHACKSLVLKVNLSCTTTSSSWIKRKH